MALSSLPLVSGLRGAHRTRRNPASSANLHARSTLRLLPPERETSADMLSVTSSSGTPPRTLNVWSRHASRSSVVLPGVGMKTCLRE